MNKEHIQALLQEEFIRIEGDLLAVARKVDDDWVANMPEHDDAEEDDTIEADRMELFEVTNAKVKVLEVQIRNVEDALVKLENDTYGSCEVCNNPIESLRLEKKPQARTCVSHM